MVVSTCVGLSPVEKRFGDEIVAACHRGTRPAFEISKAGHKHHGRLAMLGQGAQFGAKLEPFERFGIA